MLTGTAYTIPPHLGWIDKAVSDDPRSDFAAFFSYRENLFSRKPYPVLNQRHLIKHFEQLKALLRTGEVGIYFGLYPEWNGEKWIWPVLDIDGEHKNTESAIARALILLEKFHEMGLTPWWILSGTGLRCGFNFLIPFELRAGFLAWLETFKEYGVDAGPYSSPDPAPIRLFCDRAHWKQKRVEDKPLKRHTCLIDEETLLSLRGLEDYRFHTRGKPRPNEYIEGLGKILPTAAYTLNDPSTPDKVRAFLKLLVEFQIRTELRENIFDDFMFPYSRNGQRINIQRVLELLDSLGIQYSERDGFFLLSICPVCGRKHKAYLLLNGVVRCFRTSCEAWKGNGGLPLSKWAGEGFECEYEDDSELESKDAEPDFIDLAEAEKMVWAHIEKPGNVAIGATPGLGKSRCGIAKAVEEAKKSRILYALPRHDLIDEQINSIKSVLGETPLIHYYGRREKKPQTCLNYAAVKKAAAMGFEPAKTACLSCEYHPNRVKRRSYKSWPCGYYRQLEPLKNKNGGLIFCVSHHLPFLLGESMRIKRVYVDEQAVPAIIQKSPKIDISALETIRPYFPGKAANALDAIHRAAQLIQSEMVKNGKKIGRLYSEPPGGTQWKKDYGRLWTAAKITKDEARNLLAPSLIYLLECEQSLIYAQGINRNALLWLATVLGKGVAWIHIDTRNAQGHLSFERMVRYQIPKKTEITVLDATASIEELRALFQRDVDMLNVNVAWEGKRIFLRQKMGTMKVAKLDKQQLKKYLKIMVSHIPEGVTRALLITYKHVEPEALEILQDLRPNIAWQSTHYYAARGSNKFEFCQAVLAFGLPITSPGPAADVAATLFPDDHEQQVGWINYQNEAELYQCVHRARFIRYPGRSLILMGHDWPEHLLGKPDLVVDRRQNQHSENSKQMLDRALAIYDKLGFFTKETAAWVGIGLKQDEKKIKDTMGALRIILEQIEEFQNLTRVSTSIYNIINIAVDTRGIPLLFSRRNTWGELLTEIERARPNAHQLSVRLPSWGGERNFTHAVGSIEAARRWTEEFNEVLKRLGYDAEKLQDFNEEAWKERP